MRVVVEQFYEEPLSEDVYTAASTRLDAALTQHESAWRRSYLSADRMRMTCEFEAPDEDAVRAAFREADVPCHDAWVAEVTAVED
ncbi:MAG TPA: nickel-binding protein, partial [Labilithrix sp.]